MKKYVKLVFSLATFEILESLPSKPIRTIMQILSRPTTPEWYSSALYSLQIIEGSICDHDDDDFVLPDSSVFEAVRNFLEDLRLATVELILGEPKLSVSPNGYLELTYRGDGTVFIAQFKPAFSFFCKSAGIEATGYSTNEAFNFIKKHFRL